MCDTDADLDVIARLCADPLLSPFEARQGVALAGDSDDDDDDAGSDCAA